jgi:hypothetical protein
MVTKLGIASTLEYDDILISFDDIVIRGTENLVYLSSNSANETIAFDK